MALTLVQKTCSICGKRYSNRDKRPQKYCSQFCYRSDIAEKNSLKPKKVRGVTPEELRDRIDYNQDTGMMFWKKLIAGTKAAEVWNEKYAGKCAIQGRKNGYQFINLYKFCYSVHRVAWAIYYGKWPSRNIDHRNGKPEDNRIKNLRLATQSQNVMNTKLRADSKSGHKGVCWRPIEKKWFSHITIDGKQISIGNFNIKNDAIEARKRAEIKYFGEFSIILSRDHEDE